MGERIIAQSQFARLQHVAAGLWRNKDYLDIFFIFSSNAI